MKVFIVHGWTYSLDKWDNFVQDLRQKGIEPVQLKVPGLTTPSQEVWTMDQYVEWLHKELENEPNPILIGHSNGGRIILSYIQKYQGHISRLILIDSASIPRDTFIAKVKLKLIAVLAKVGKVFSKIPIFRRVFYKIIGAQDYNNAAPNMKLTMANMLDADKSIDLSQIRIPVTLIWGSRDKLTPLRDGLRMKKGIVGSELHVIDEARHSPFFTHTEQVVDIVMKSLDNQS